MTENKEQLAARAIVARAIENAKALDLSLTLIAYEMRAAVNSICTNVDIEEAREHVVAELLAGAAIMAPAAGNA